VIAAASPSALWYLTRGTGLVTLLCLTASVVLGIVEVRRWAPADSPRYLIVALHRGISLLVVALLAIHVATAVLDSFAPIRLADAVLPFTSAYRPLWLGLGALALDGLLALTVTSLLRRRLGLRAWRAVHWIAYACWPVALAHSWGTGSDARTPWMLGLTLACAAAVIAAVAWRLAGGWTEHPRVRGSAAAATLVTIGVLGVWLALGPLAPGWAQRAGTPRTVLAAPKPARRPVAAGIPALERTFSARLRGSLHQGTSAGGQAVVDVRLQLTGAARGVLRIRLAGRPDGSGGVIMSRSAVRLGPSTAPGLLQGRIDALQGASVEALVGASDGHAMRLRIDLALEGSGARGTISGQPVGS
jgi:sulfoxide reductase heme-binding subunit YedZ